MAFAQLAEAVPFYRGLTLEEIGGRGVRWAEREAASEMPAGGEQARPTGGRCRRFGLRGRRSTSEWGSAARDVPVDLGRA